MDKQFCAVLWDSRLHDAIGMTKAKSEIHHGHALTVALKPEGHCTLEYDTVMTESDLHVAIENFD